MTTTLPYRIHFDLLDQQVDFEGVFRPTSAEEIESAFRKLAGILASVNGTLKLNFRRLRYINANGVGVLSRFIRHAREHKSVRIAIIASSVVAWSERVLPNLKNLWDDIEFRVHDQNFYKSQGIIEDQGFIPLLRNQTRILWPLEKEVLRQHGLRAGLRVADICCGCGDVPLLIAREFQPTFITGVDHSQPSVAYARRLQAEFEIANAEFVRGDATALLLPDDSFDFVLCRLSLQIFSQPEQILAELVRITRPGGRIYTLCEDYDLIVGHPEDDLIRRTYDRAARYGEAMGMDLVSGKKLHSMLSQARLEDVRTDHIVVSTANTEREAFAQVIESWKTFSVETIGNDLALSAEDRDSLLAGYEAHLRTIRSENGYTTWTMVASSARKPLKGTKE